MSSVDYTGRSVDLFIFQGAAPQGEQLITLSFGGETGGKVIAGVQKLAQSWALLFLTEIGSVPSQPTRGCTFVTQLRAGALRDEGNVGAAFAAAVETLAEQFQVAEAAASPALPNDEKLQAAELDRFTQNRVQGKLTLYVRLTSQAGTVHELLVPIPVAIK